MWGFSDSIPKLLGEIAELISFYKPTEERFNAMRELLARVQRNLNFGALQSAQIVENERLNYTMEGYVTPYSQLKFLEAMTFKHVITIFFIIQPLAKTLFYRSNCICVTTMTDVKSVV